MPKKDPLGDLDLEFDRLLKVLFYCPVSSEVSLEALIAAQRMVEIAREQGDPTLWKIIFGRMNDFISEGVAPPMPFLVGVNEAFRKFDQEGGVSLDAAFGVRTSKKGRKSTFNARELQMERASIVDHFIKKKGCSLEEAAQRTAEKLVAKYEDGGFQGGNGCVSADTIRKDYLKWRDYVFDDIDWDLVWEAHRGL